MLSLLRFALISFFLAFSSNVKADLNVSGNFVLNLDHSAWQGTLRYKITGPYSTYSGEHPFVPGVSDPFYYSKSYCEAFAAHYELISGKSLSDSPVYTVADNYTPPRLYCDYTIVDDNDGDPETCSQCGVVVRWTAQYAGAGQGEFDPNYQVKVVAGPVPEPYEYKWTGDISGSDLHSTPDAMCASRAASMSGSTFQYHHNFVEYKDSSSRKEGYCMAYMDRVAEGTTKNAPVGLVRLGNTIFEDSRYSASYSSCQQYKLDHGQWAYQSEAFDTPHVMSFGNLCIASQNDGGGILCHGSLDRTETVESSSEVGVYYAKGFYNLDGNECATEGDYADPLSVPIPNDNYRYPYGEPVEPYEESEPVEPPPEPDMSHEPTEGTQTDSNDVVASEIDQALADDFDELENQLYLLRASNGVQMESLGKTLNRIQVTSYDSASSLHTVDQRLAQLMDQQRRQHQELLDEASGGASVPFTGDCSDMQSQISQLDPEITDEALLIAWYKTNCPSANLEVEQSVVDQLDQELDEQIESLEEQGFVQRQISNVVLGAMGSSDYKLSGTTAVSSQCPNLTFDIPLFQEPYVVEMAPFCDFADRIRPLVTAMARFSVFAFALNLFLGIRVVRTVAS